MLMAIARATRANVKVRTLRSRWYEQMMISCSDWHELEASLRDMLENSVPQNIEEVRNVPLTMGALASDLSILRKRILPRLGIEVPKGRVFQQVSMIAQTYAKRIPLGSIIEVLTKPWRSIVSDDQVLLIPSVEGMKSRHALVKSSFKLPSITRSVNLYESGRFFGLRDERERGGIKKGMVDVRADEHWWLISLLAICSCLVSVERIDRGEYVHLYLCVVPEHGFSYDVQVLSRVRDLREKIVGWLRRTGIYMEDLQFMNYLLLMRSYYELRSEVGTTTLFTKHPLSFKLIGIRAVGRRFSESFEQVLPLERLAVIDLALTQAYGEEAEDVAKCLSALGLALVRILKVYSGLARELAIDRLVVLYKHFISSLLEPGRPSYLKPLYELLRTLRIEDYRARLLGALAKRIMEVEGLEKEEARALAIKSFRHIEQALIEVATR